LTMIIDLASVGKDPKLLEMSFGPDQIELDEGVSLIGSAGFTGEVSRGSDDRTTVRGHISAKVAADCARCLEPVERPVEIDFEDVFAEATSELTDDEIEVQSRDLDESLVTSPEIDLAEVVREQLILATDEAVLCKEGCSGLCPKCGGNRNLIDCECSNDEVDPRWAALKNLN
jgi:uncharacterized protein